jgi:hypothetical protein
MVGIPTLLIRKKNVKVGDTILEQHDPTPTLIPLTRLDELPEGVAATSYPRFVAKIYDNVEFPDIDGMSGGPIFGVGKSSDGKDRYWIVAVQSSWLKSRRITFGCPLPVFAQMVDDALYERYQEDQGPDET